MSGRRLQIVISDEAWGAVEALVREAGDDFEAGTINVSDAINEMILTAKVDIKHLQSKHTDIRRSLRLMAAREEVDLDEVIKSLMELRSRTGKRSKAGRETADA